jgi:outer membrane protein assembly factor BamB
MSTPVHGDGLLYGLASRRKGQFVALNAETGALKWATEGREGEHASALLAPQHVVLLTNAGGLIILNRNAEKFDVVRRVTVADSETWAVPVLLRADLLVRDAGGLKRLTPMQ